MMIKPFYYRILNNQAQGENPWPNYDFDAISLVIAGQSNAKGQTYGENPPEEISGVIPFAFDPSFGWYNVAYKLNGSVDGEEYGIDIPFAYYAGYLLGVQYGIETNIIKRASGGTGFFDGDWNATTGPLAIDTYNKITSLKAREIDRGYSNPLRVFFWNQGESDNNNLTIQEYVDEFMAMLEYYESNFGQQFDAVIIARLRRTGSVRDAHAEIINNNMGSRSGFLIDLIDDSRYPMGIDGTHFTSVAVDNQGKDAFQIVANYFFGKNYDLGYTPPIFAGYDPPALFDEINPEIADVQIKFGEPDKLVIIFDKPVNISNIVGLTLNGDWS